MKCNLHITCDRCKLIVPDATKDCDGTTSGYYEVYRGTWSKFAVLGEKYLCDACMWAEPKYQAIYGTKEAQP